MNLPRKDLERLKDVVFNWLFESNLSPVFSIYIDPPKDHSDTIHLVIVGPDSTPSTELRLLFEDFSAKWAAELSENFEKPVKLYLCETASGKKKYEESVPIIYAPAE